MNNWEQFLRSLRGADEVTIVGPLLPPNIPLAEPLIFVDGGCAFRGDHSGISVGDGDSYSGSLDYVLPKEKNFSDLAFVLGAIPKNIKFVRLFGFLGERRDHELLNFGEAHRFLNASESRREIIFDNSIIGFSAGQWTFSAEGTFSVVSLSETRIRLRGSCRYQIPELGEMGALSSLGLSNVGWGEIQLQCESPIFIFFNGR